VFCRDCGKEQPGGAAYCWNCGTHVAAPAVASAAMSGGYATTSGWAPAMPSSKERPAVIAGLDPSVTVCSAWRRLGAYLLEGVLVIVTLLIGWLIWSFIIFNRGQTPAKQLLGMRVVHKQTLLGARWGRMFLREFPCKWLIGIAASVFFLPYILYFWLIWDGERQEIWDKMVDTIVVNDRQDLLDPRGR
jgi:uncharacterized RDD family membrane protein YckC